MPNPIKDFWPKIPDPEVEPPKMTGPADWNWKPEEGTCVCGHSHMWHWLAPPHGCNHCNSCRGYSLVKS